MFWSEADAIGWHPGVDESRVRDAHAAAEAFVAERCRWKRFDPYTGAPVAAPESLALAVRLLTARFLSRHNSPDGLAMGGSDLGPVRVTSIDRDVERLIAPYRPVVFG